MTPALLLIVAIYVCFRFLEIGQRERRAGRWLLPTLAVLGIAATILVTYSTLKTSAQSERISAIHNMTDTELQRQQFICGGTSGCTPEEQAAIAEEQAMRKAK